MGTAANQTKFQKCRNRWRNHQKGLEVTYKTVEMGASTRKPPKHRGSTVGAILPWKDLQTQPKSKNTGIDGATPKRRCKSFQTCRERRIYNKSIKTSQECCKCCIPVKDMETQPKPKNAGIDGATPKKATHPIINC